MTIDAIGGGMCAGQWKIGSVMIKTAFSTSCWMAFEAGLTVVDVTLHIAMFIIHISLVMLVATDATVFGIICRICVTIGASVPFAIMLS